MTRFSMFLLLLLPFLVSGTAIDSSQQTPLTHDPMRTMESWEWEDCGTPSDIVQIQSITVSPDPPRRGKNITVKVAASTTKEIEDGAYAPVVVKLGLIKIFSKTYDICEEARKADDNVQCPVQSGAFTIEHSAFISGKIPQAKYTIDVNAYTVDDEHMLCVRLHVNMFVL